MLVKCLECKKDIDATEELKRHECGLLYGLTPYFPFDDFYIRKTGKKLKGVPCP